MYYTVLNAEKLSKILDKPIKEGTFLKTFNSDIKKFTLTDLVTEEVFTHDKNYFQSNMGFDHKFNVGDMVRTKNGINQIISFFDNFKDKIYILYNLTTAYEHEVVKTKNNTDKIIDVFDNFNHKVYFLGKLTAAYEHELEEVKSDLKHAYNVWFPIPDNARGKLDTNVINDDDILKNSIQESTKCNLKTADLDKDVFNYYNSLSRAELNAEKEYCCDDSIDIFESIVEDSKEQKIDTVEVIQKNIGSNLSKYEFREYTKDFKLEVKKALDEFLNSNPIYINQAPKVEYIQCEVIVKKSQFNIGDKVRIIKDLKKYLHLETSQETINLKGFEGEIISFKDSLFDYLNYTLDINGKKFDHIPETFLQLVEKAKTNVVDVYKYSQEYEDIDGVLLPNVIKPVNLIQSYKKD